MKLDSVPGFIARKLLRLEERAAHLQAEVDRAAEGIAHAQGLIRDPGRMTPPQLRDVEHAWKSATDAQPGRVDRAENAKDTIAACKRWLASLPEGTELQQREVDVGERSLADVRARLAECGAELKKLRSVPTPSADIEQRVRAYVASLGRPKLTGIEVGKELRVEWPADGVTLAAFVAADVIVAALLLEVERMANTPLPAPQRERRIAALVKEWQELRYVEEVLLTAKDERSLDAPAWAILSAAVAREEEKAVA